MLVLVGVSCSIENNIYVNMYARMCVLGIYNIITCLHGFLCIVLTMILY